MSDDQPGQYVANAGDDSVKVTISAEDGEHTLYFDQVHVAEIRPRLASATVRGTILLAYSGEGGEAFDRTANALLAAFKRALFLYHERAAEAEDAG